MKTIMGRTAIYRANKMTGMKTAEIITTFPYLSIPQLLLHEANIRFGKDFDKMLLRGLDMLTEAIIKKASKSNKETASRYEEIINRCLEDGQVSGLKKNAAVLLLPSLLGEKAEQLFVYNTEETSPYPLLKMSGGVDILHSVEIYVMADKCVLTEDDGSTDCTLGLCLVMAAYWVYGFEYPKTLRKTFGFLETYIYNLNRTRTVPMSLVRLHTELTHLG